MTTCLPSSDSSFGGMPDSLAWKNRLRKNVATMSSRWWPSAILVMPFAAAQVYSAPRRSREHSEHMVRPSGITRLTTE